MHLLPPNSTLFPYTTLFRSQCKDFITQGKVEDEIIVFDNHQRLIDSVDDSKLLLKYPLTMMGQTIEVTVEYSKDRKSTRLNSSHVAISYAVFCLNKK